ncbi:MAG: hypothetical protein U0414_12750 [Polyangiaceae bacterium]
MRSLRLPCIAVALLLARPSTSFADDATAPDGPAKVDRDTTAQALYASATALMDARRFDEACPKLEEVTRLIPEGIGAHLTLAECYEGAGRTAGAWSEYLVAEAAARRANQADRQAKASAKIAELEPHLARITVLVPVDVRSLPGLVVTRDGVVVGAAQFGEAIPVDPGEHVLEASAAGKSKWSTRVAAPADAPPAVVTVAALVDASPPIPPPSTGGRAFQLPLGLAIGGLGLAAIGVGFGLGGVALGDANDAEAECDASLACTQRGLDLRADARVFADAATGLLVAGGALTLTGIVVAATTPSAARANVSVSVSVSVGRLDVRGSF